MSNFKSNSKILFGISGSIAAYKVLNAVSALVKAGHEVQCVGTKSALQFIGPAAVEGLTGRPFLTDVFESGHMMDHIHLARWADIFVIAPASANTIAKCAHGFADDLISTLLLATEPHVPKLLAPAMNPQMWMNSVVQNNVQALQKMGVQILTPTSGTTACGEIGEGRLIEPADLEKEILAALTPSPSTGRILITSGGTTEPIDSVRSITNTSSGKTGTTLAEELTRQGHEVHLLASKSAQKPERPIFDLQTYVTFNDLATSLQNKLETTSFDLVIHAAAVSDYSVSQVNVDGKILEIPASSKIQTGSSVQVTLKQNPKLIDQIKSWSVNPSVKLIGFKLTDEEDLTAQIQRVKELMAHAHPDWVVQNDKRDISQTSHSYRFFNAKLEHLPLQDARDLARQIGDLL